VSTTLAGYGPKWATPIVGLTELAPPVGTPIILHSGETLVFSATGCFTLTVPINQQPTGELAQLFAHTTGMPLGACSYGGLVWWIVQAAADQFKVYSWSVADGVVLRYMTTDGAAPAYQFLGYSGATMWTHGSYVYIAYCSTVPDPPVDRPCTRVRRSTNGVTWTDMGTTGPSQYGEVPRAGCGNGTDFYVTCFRGTEITPGMALFSNNTNLGGGTGIIIWGIDGLLGIVALSNPVLFNSKIYFIAGGFPILLYEVNLSSGAVATTDLSSLVVQLSTTSCVMVSWNGSLYICNDLDSPYLFKSDGADTSSWEQVT
jgi:hypothetical protein